MSVFVARPTVRGRRGAVACGHPLGVWAGLRLFDLGGGAVDAAVAAAAALAVVMPDACGLGGDAMFLIQRGVGNTVAFNGSGAAPMRLSHPIAPDGAMTAAVPGAVAAWLDALERYGRLPAGDILAPAITLATHGFPAGDRLLAAVRAQRRRLEHGATGWDLLGTTLRPGAILRQLTLAESLRLIAREGADGFYRGQISEAIARRSRADGGEMTPDDLAAHRTVIQQPLTCQYGSAEIHLQPPVSQAVLAGLVLRTLEQVTETDAFIQTHCAIEATESAFQHRDTLAASGTAERLLAGGPLPIDFAAARRLGGPKGYGHTTAVSTADSDGTVVSMVISVFDDFGAAALVPEGGFCLNNRLTGFSTTPGSPNAPAPGRRPISTLSPALVTDDERSMAVATPGADGQVQTLVQLIDDMIRRRSDVAAALARPRWRSLDGRLMLEESFSEEIATALKERGHLIECLPDGDDLFGAAAVAGIDLRQRTVFAHADPRRETWAGAL